MLEIDLLSLILRFIKTRDIFSGNHKLRVTPHDHWLWEICDFTGDLFVDQGLIHRFIVSAHTDQNASWLWIQNWKDVLLETFL